MRLEELKVGKFEFSLGCAVRTNHANPKVRTAHPTQVITLIIILVITLVIVVIEWHSTQVKKPLVRSRSRNPGFGKAISGSLKANAHTVHA